MTHPAKLAALALQQVAKVLDKLTEEQLTALADGRAQVEFRWHEVVVTSGRTRAPRSAAASKVDVDEVVTAVRGMASATDVLEYLQRRDKELKVDDLKAIAVALGPTVSTKGRSKSQLRQNIAEGTAGFRQASETVLGGAWRS